MDLTLMVARLEELRLQLDQFMQGVRVTSEPEEWAYEFDMKNAAILRSFLGALLIDNPAAGHGAVWPMLECRVPADLLAHPDVEKQKAYLSAPLNGTPTEILTRMRILPIRGPWHEVEQAVQNSLQGEQIVVMRLLDEELLR